MPWEWKKKSDRSQRAKLADLVIWDMTTPGMVAAAHHDAVAAILVHSSVRDVDTVIVDGIVRKENGKLKAFDNKGKKMEWAEIAKEFVASREEIQRRANKVDYQQASKDLAASMGQ